MISFTKQWPIKVTTIPVLTNKFGRFRAVFITFTEHGHQISHITWGRESLPKCHKTFHSKYLDYIFVFWRVCSIIFLNFECHITPESNITKGHKKEAEGLKSAKKVSPII